MKKIILISVILIATVFPQNMRKNSYYSLFSDQKASYIGDAITIIVIESSLAKNNAKTKTGRESDLGFNLAGTVDATAIPGVDLGIASNNTFSGSGSTESSGMIETKISATIRFFFMESLPRDNFFAKIITRTADTISDSHFTL
jgi:flagellar basal body L-ring protein FlgH